MKKSISMKLIEVYLIFALVVITYSSAIPKPGEDKKNRVHEQVMLLTSTLSVKYKTTLLSLSISA